MANILKFLGFDSFIEKSITAYKGKLNDIDSRVNEIASEVNMLAFTSKSDEDISKIVKGCRNELETLSSKKKALFADFQKTVKNGLEKGFKYEGKMVDSLGRSRADMPQVNQSDLDSYLIHFSGNSNNAKVTKCKMKLSKLKPSQEDIDIDKVITGLTNDDWKERNYIVSQDNHIVDGHHSWASGLEIDPDTEVTVYKVNLPAKELIRRSKLLKITRGSDTDIVKGCLDDFVAKDELPSFFEGYDIAVSVGTMMKLKAGEPVLQGEIIKGDLCDAVLNKDSFEKTDVFVDGVGERSFYVVKSADTFEKAEYGIYADNAQNRKLNRVGEKYSKDAKGDEPKPDKAADSEDKNTRKHNQQLASFAKEATDKELQDAVKNKELGDVEKEVAEKELKARGLVEDEKKEGDGKEKQLSKEEREKNFKE